MITYEQANVDYLMDHLARVRRALEHHASRMSGENTGSEVTSNALPPEMHHERHAALDVLCDLFGLSPFERDVLLLCAGMDLEASIGPLCAAAQGDPQRGYPTFSLALAALPDSHWTAITPAAPLRYWRLVEVGAGRSLTLSPLRIDERILHYLLGVSYLDERLAGQGRRLPAATDLVPSHHVLAKELAALWSIAREADRLPVLQLSGQEADAKQAIAAAACALLDLSAYVIAAAALPTTSQDVGEMIRLWERESLLGGSVLMLDCDEGGQPDPGRDSAIAQIAEKFTGPLILSTRERRGFGARSVITFDVQKPTHDEQRGVWHEALGATAISLNGDIDRLVAQFNLNQASIQTACNAARGRLTIDAPDHEPEAEVLAATVWDVCRQQQRPHLDDLAQRIEPAATWDDLILPETQKSILSEITMHVRQRAYVYETWGFIRKGQRGLGISALFAGASGTGKTMAAEVLADDLGLDLYRIDLSGVVSKYIGETEKNLRRVFDAAEESGAILLFDEADALFGKRSEVKDSHDRYANIEVSYLLQRMEAYRGLAILTTNLKDNLDTAFLRRIRFIVQFPFPTAAYRAAIWARIFPQAVPTNGLELRRLAQLNITGGNIRNIALRAAFLAADAGESVGMAHVLRAAEREYAKLEKPLSPAEVQGWNDEA
jgi:hypothetical protein